jgi:molybdenum cofactor cytidylyltransferase
MACANIAVALLAAGQGKRFGGDKLSADLSGTPVGLMAARTVSGMGFGAMFAVCRDEALAPALTGLGFHILHNEQPGLGQSHSLHLAVRAAEQTPVQALLVCLADMPFVSADHISSIVTKMSEHSGIIASQYGAQAMPPALFPRNCWSVLLNTKGDAGARSLLAGALHIQAPPETLIDIDTVQDLAAAQDRR